jgi:hypothetical protein
MAVIIVGNEKNFAALRSRLFSGRVSTAVVHDVTEAIAAANPHADLDALTPGTVLTIPDHPRINVSGNLSLDDTTKQALAGIAEESGAVLDQLVATSHGVDRDDASERNALSKAFTGSQLNANVVGRITDKDLTNDMKALRKAVTDEEKTAQARAAALEQASSAWSADLKTLQGLLD